MFQYICKYDTVIVAIIQNLQRSLNTTSPDLVEMRTSPICDVRHDLDTMNLSFLSLLQGRTKDPLPASYVENSARCLRNQLKHLFARMSIVCIWLRRFADFDLRS